LESADESHLLLLVPDERERIESEMRIGRRRGREGRKDEHGHDSDPVVKIDPRELILQAPVEIESDVDLDLVLERVAVASRHLSTAVDVEESVGREGVRRVPDLGSFRRHLGTVLELAVVEDSTGKDADVGVHSVLDAEGRGGRKGNQVKLTGKRREEKEKENSREKVNVVRRLPLDPNEHRLRVVVAFSGLRHNGGRKLIGI